MEMSNLTEDLLEEIFCKLPVTSLVAVRSTCKKWNTISKTQRFAEKHINKAASAAEKELSMIVVIDYKVCLMRFHNNINGIPSITQLVGFEKIDIIQVYHCDGLLLCSTRQKWTRGLVVWNPYWRQIKWISTPKHSYDIDDYYAIGYEVINNTRSYKILKFFERCIDIYGKNRNDGCEIYDLKYNSWRDIVITPQEWNMDLCRERPREVSLKGNTYWFGKENNGNNFLICFDFTRERFGPRMSFPFIDQARNVVLSSVKGEKLALLVERWNILEMEIWVTSEINPTMVSSWSKLLLTVKKRPIGEYCPFMSSYIGESFFIDEENKVVVFVGRVISKPCNKAYIYGEGGYLIREVDIGESKDWVRWPKVCYYAPSSVLIR